MFSQRVLALATTQWVSRLIDLLNEFDVPNFFYYCGVVEGAFHCKNKSYFDLFYFNMSLKLTLDGLQ